MTDSWIPAPQTGGGKLVVFLLVAGATMLLISGGLFFIKQQRADSSAEAPVATPNNLAPAPLVQPQIQRPMLPQLDTGPEPPPDKPEPAAKTERTGTIDPQTVKNFFRTHEGAVKACYERRLKINPMLEGKIDLNIVVHSSGKVGAITRNADSVRDTEMFDCIRRTIRGWKFPQPEGGQVVIAKTFNFKKK